jgi:hypothetical protein
MKRLLLLALLLPRLAWAQDPPIMTVPAGEDNIVAVKKGAPAPFDGQLFDNTTAIRWGLWIKQFNERSQLDQQRVQSICTAQINYKDALANIESEKSSNTVQDLMTRLQRSETARLNAEHELASPPWYRSGTFQFTLGVLSAVVTGVVVERIVH